MRTSPLPLTFSAALLAVFVASSGGPQAAGPQDAAESRPLAFEVASVKRNPPVGDGPTRVMLSGLKGNRWTAENVTLLMLIRQAWGQQFSMQGQIVGGPSWLETERFTVSAIAEGQPTPDEARLMLQRLLADRFKLVAHVEQRELPVFALVLARSDGRLGRDLQSTDVDCEALRAERAALGTAAPPPPEFTPGGPPPPCSTMIMMGGQTMRLRSGGSTIAQITQLLSSSAGRPVIDRTGLTGYYTLSLEFASEPGAPSPFGGPPPAGPPGGGATATSDLPSIFSAVQDQLGLRLDPRRDLTDVLVIDSAELPLED